MATLIIILKCTSNVCSSWLSYLPYNDFVELLHCNMQRASKNVKGGFENKYVYWFETSQPTMKRMRVNNNI